jgi:surface protein
MDILTMVLIKRQTGIPLDLVIFINTFLYEKLTDENFKQAIALWFDNKEECKWRFGHISDWNTSRITDMERTFYCREGFNEDISRWNVSNVTDMSGMFFEATQFNGDLSHWDVSNVTDMVNMFFRATQFNGDLSRWNVQKVITMRGMFFGARNFDGGDLSQWDVKNVRDMGYMFSGASQFNGNIGPWEVAVGTNVEGMFHEAMCFTEDLSHWKAQDKTMVRWSSCALM